MKVLMLSEVSAATVIGGAERVLHEQVCGLARADDDVRAVVRLPAGDGRPQVTIAQAVEQRYPVTRTSEAGFVMSSLRNSLRAYDQARAGRQLDAVIVHQSLAALAPIQLRTQTARVWLYVCHSLAHEEYRSRLRAHEPNGAGPSAVLKAGLRRWIERYVVRRCQRVIVLSDFMRERVHRVHGVPESRLVTLPGAADVERFRPPENRAALRRDLKLPPDRLVLLTVRNLVPRMGLEALLKAVEALSDERQELYLVVGGEGPLRPLLEREIKARGLGGTVHLVGFIPEALLPAYYQAADLVIMPTQELEGFGLVTVEALACATPVLGTPVGAIPEVLRRVDPALITEGSDAGALADSLRRILRRFRENPGERDRLGARGRYVVEAHYTWPRHVAALRTLLEDLLAGGPA